MRSRGLEFEVNNPRPANTNPTRVWALIAGTTHYQGGKIDLSFPAKDAADFSTGLQTAAGRLFGAENVHIALFTSPRAEFEPQPDAMHRPTRANLVQALEALSDPQRVKPGDVVIVYLAGHGVARGGAEDSFYYLTCEAQSCAARRFGTAQQWTISDRELTQWLKNSPAQKQVMILDTCQSGKVVEDLMLKREISSSQERALERVKDSHRFLSFWPDVPLTKRATKPRGTAKAFLTYALLFGMRGGALKDEQFVDVSRLFDFAKNEVPHLAGDIGGVQQPVIASPNGSTFVIGQVTTEDQAKIPLQPARPLVLRTSFHDDQELDPLDLSGQLDDLLRDVAATTRGNVSLAFVDARRSPGAYRLAGNYQMRNEQVTVNVHLVSPDGTAAQFPIVGEKSQVGGIGRQDFRSSETTVSHW